MTMNTTDLRLAALGVLGVSLLLACGAGSKTEADSAPPPAPEAAAPAPEPSTASAAESSEETEAAEAEKPAQAEPVFTPGMTVDQAINAVPSTSDRLEVEQEVLAAPLLDPALYEPCSLRQSDHFRLRVAVWRGRAVGIDLSTKPKNEKLETCVRAQVEKLEWKDKVPSLNTVEYNQ